MPGVTSAHEWLTRYQSAISDINTDYNASTTTTCKGIPHIVGAAEEKDWPQTILNKLGHQTQSYIN